MSKKVLLAIGISIALAIAALVAFLMLASPSAKFIVKNSDSEPVRVVAHWRDKTKDIGAISPGDTVEFSVDDEAAMSFEVVRANGTGVNTGATYFTTGVSTVVEITHTTVRVKFQTDNPR